MGSRFKIVTCTALAVALAGCGGANEADSEIAGAEATGAASGEMASADPMATGTPAAGGETPTTAPEFVAMAASGGMYEVESSRLAQQQATKPEVKSFAEMMIKDHTAANQELKAAAAKATPPATVPATLNPEHQSMLDQLKTAGANFDQAYMDQQRTAHEKTLALLNTYAASGDSQPLKDWATKTKGPVQNHLDRAKQVSTAQ